MYRSVNGRPVICLCSIVHYSCAHFQYSIVAIYVFQCCTFFILHFFYVVLFSYCTISIAALFCVVIFFMSFYVSVVKSVSTRHKIPCRYFNYDIEHEWTLKKLVSALLFSTLLSHNYRPKRGRTFC